MNYRDILPDACKITTSLENLTGLCPLKKVGSVVVFMPTEDMKVFFEILSLGIGGGYSPIELQHFFLWDALLQRSFAIEIEKMKSIALKSEEDACSSKSIQSTIKFVQLKNELFTAAKTGNYSSHRISPSDRYISKLSNFAEQF